MEEQVEGNGERKRAEFETDVLSSIKVETERDSGEVAVLKQRRKKDDGRWGGVFVNLKIDTGRRSLFVSPEMAPKVLAALQELVPSLMEERRKLKEEWESRQKEYVEQQAQQVPQGGFEFEGGGQRRTRRTGKTERKRQKHREAGGR